jgi:hypothetical protein
MAAKTTNPANPIATDNDGALPPPPAAGAGLESLAQQFEHLEAGGEPGTPATTGDEVQAEPPKPTNTEICVGMFATLRETFCEFTDLKAPRLTLTDDKCEKLGAIWGGCADHYGIDLQGQMGKWGALGMAAFASVAILMPTIQATRAEIATKDGRSKPAAVPAAPPPSLVTDRGAANAQDFASGVIKPAFEQ